MEQQIVSIVKAGITTSLNAGTTVLAVVNHARGRYDLRQSLVENCLLLGYIQAAQPLAHTSDGLLGQLTLDLG
ncbi:hypothetical protein IEQ34_021192 [Dendrobium chrysotoxum]|uniref:MCM C-terminal AAA(+) ATPase domain-containing protein n=1 Tax=Dendrobium chrysotoxum TaxID=161865 RepID=A0AAV7G437_DENCH|nr:hypothetical protein IEQ34_021192 [Dendrobium chrysotoxum]